MARSTTGGLDAHGVCAWQADEPGRDGSALTELELRARFPWLAALLGHVYDWCESEEPFTLLDDLDLETDAQLLTIDRAGDGWVVEERRAAHPTPCSRRRTYHVRGWCRGRGSINNDLDETELPIVLPLAEGEVVRRLSVSGRGCWWLACLASEE